MCPDVGGCYPQFCAGRAVEGDGDVGGSQDALDDGGHLEAAELAEPVGEPLVAALGEGFVHSGEEFLELLAGIVPLGEPAGADSHAERVPAGVTAAAGRRVDLGGECPQFPGAPEVRGYLLLERVVVAEPGALGAFQPGQLGVGFGLVHQ